MQFRLIYEGKLPPSGTSHRALQVKHEIRRVLHPQLKDLCERNILLSQQVRSSRRLLFNTGGDENYGHDDQYWRDCNTPDFSKIGDKGRLGGFEFVPIVLGDIHGVCDLDILFLRRERPGSLITKHEYGGDLDNRLKIFFDALRMPHEDKELPKGTSPSAEEVPFLCLLEDDSLITSFRVETDTLLGNAESSSLQHVSLIVRVTTHPTEVTPYNLKFMT